MKENISEEELSHIYNLDSYRPEPDGEIYSMDSYPEKLAASKKPEIFSFELENLHFLFWQHDDAFDRKLKQLKTPVWICLHLLLFTPLFVFADTLWNIVNSSSYTKIALCLAAILSYRFLHGVQKISMFIYCLGAGLMIFAFVFLIAFAFLPFFQLSFTGLVIMIFGRVMMLIALHHTNIGGEHIGSSHKKPGRDNAN